MCQLNLMVSHVKINFFKKMTVSKRKLNTWSTFENIEFPIKLSFELDDEKRDLQGDGILFNNFNLKLLIFAA